MALFWFAIILRSVIASLPPVLPLIQSQLNMDDATAGFTTTIPLLCFGCFAFITPSVQKRLGTNTTLVASLVLITIGSAMRIVPNTQVLLLSTVAIGMGVAISNVLFPVILRTHYPSKIAQAMGIFTFLINVGAGMGSISSAILLAYGMTWNASLAVWTLPALLVIAFWIPSQIGAKTTGEESHSDSIVENVLRETPEPEREKETSHWHRVIKNKTVWLLAAFMGIQSLIYYNLMTWIPSMLKSVGFDDGYAGFMYSTFNTIAVLGALVSTKMFTAKNTKTLVIVFYVIYIIATFGLLFGGWYSIIASVVTGICQGATYTMGLTLIASQPEPELVPTVSAFSQGAGYLIVAIGPVFMGVLYTMSQNWYVPTIFLAITMVANCLTFIIAKKRMDIAVASHKQLQPIN